LKPKRNGLVTAKKYNFEEKRPEATRGVKKNTAVKKRASIVSLFRTSAHVDKNRSCNIKEKGLQSPGFQED
jgi:hypothetical protein